MKRWIALVLFLVLGFTARGQVLVTTFTDPCTKEVKLITVPLTGSTVVTLYNKSRSFTAADVTSGALYQWISDAYLAWSARNPCSTNQAASTATQVAASTVSSVVASAVSVPPPPPPPVAPPPPAPAASAPAPAASEPAPASGGESSGGESSSSSSESKSEEKSESKSESKSSSKTKSESKGKGGAKAARMNPMLLSSDLTVAQNLDLSVNVIIASGVSQSSMAGDESYGATGMIWSNLKQFAFNARYTKMNFKDGQLKSINNFSYTWAYSYGTKMGVLGFAHIRPLGKLGVTGVNLSQITIGIPYVMGVTADGEQFLTKQSAFLFSVTGFYTKPITLNKRWNISPEMYVTCNPYMFMTRDHMSIRNYTLNFLSGMSGDFSITKRFKLSMSTKASFSTDKQIPILLNFLIGSKINL